jgi:hypothetical protein
MPGTVSLILLNVGLTKKVCVSIRKIQYMCFFLGFTKFKGFGSLLVIGCVLLFTVGRGRSAEKKFG